MRNPFLETTYAVAFRKTQSTNERLFHADNGAPFTLVKNTWRYWYADPIVFSNDGREWLFVEKMDRLTRRGCISVAEIKDGYIGEFTDVLNETFHLSYPMVFKKNNRIYMIPESTSGKCVNLYESVDFPYKWKLKFTLFEDVLYADTTVVFSENRWYLITGKMDPKIGSKVKPLVFAADNIEKGELIAFEGNRESAFSFVQRGAGNFFSYQGSLIRPIQCGNETEYGKYLRFTKALPENIAAEEEIAKIQTNQISGKTKKTPCGIHTYALSRNLEIIDLKFEQNANIPVVLSKIGRKIRGKR